jgi:hypothetical protein
MNPLNSAILAAHASGDTSTLVDLYAQAAKATQDADQSAFYLTHAHIFALEANHPAAGDLRAQLIAAGRDAPLEPPRPRKV